MIILAKKIYISPSNQEANLYATGGTNEKEQCYKIARACYNFLKEQGFSVKCTYNENMYERVRESNLFNADIHLAIHTNATAKHNVTGGTQILLYSLMGERKKVGKAVLDRLGPFTPGSTAERLIEKPSFYEINSATGLTVYCECEFHDTKEGSDFIIKNTKKIGELIAMGICDYYGVKIIEKNKTDNGNNSENNSGNNSEKSENNILYTVQVGAFENKNNAIKYSEKIKKAGFDAVVLKKKNK